MKNRRELAKLFNYMGFKVGAEVGVAQGYYSVAICEENPGVKLSCIDFWDSYAEYKDMRKTSTFKKFYEEAQRLLTPFGCELIKEKSLDAANRFDDESLDFVYIDSNHAYSAVKEDIEAWAPKVRIGGIVSGHDYYISPRGSVGVIKAVDEYVKANGQDLLLTDWDRENESVDERQPSWYFIKK